jgi:hypothetical protein
MRVAYHAVPAYVGSRVPTRHFQDRAQGAAIAGLDNPEEFAQGHWLEERCATALLIRLELLIQIPKSCLRA